MTGPCGPDDTRRRFLAGMAAAGVTLACGDRARAADEGLLMRKIPATGETLPAIGLGTWSAFDVPDAGVDFDQARAALARFAALGGRVVDTSPMYGRAERVLGLLATAVDPGHKLFLATKIWTEGREAGQRQLANALALLGRKPIDLVQVHNLVALDAHLATLREAKVEGSIRYVGITHYTASAHAELERVLRRERLDFLQVNYSLAEPQADQRLLDAAAERGVAVLVNRPLAEGAMLPRLRGKPLPGFAADLGCTNGVQLALKWIVAHPAVTCVLVGTRNPAHVEDNLVAGRGPLPTAAQREAIAGWFAA